MRILITGAGGQLGRELVDVFSDQEVTATDRRTLDIESRSSVLDAITGAKPNVIVHAGAWTAVDDCESDVDRAMRANALSVRHVVEAADRVGARVIYVSTDYVFDGTKPTGYDEWDATNPQTVYGRSKLGGEHELRTLDTTVRTSWVFGRHGSNIVKTVLRLAESVPELKFVNDQRGKPTCAADLAGRIKEFALHELHGTFHVTNEGETTWFDLAQDIFRLAGHDPERIAPISTAEQVPPRPARRPANSVLDNEAVKLQGIPLLSDHREALERIVKELHTS